MTGVTAAALACAAFFVAHPCPASVRRVRREPPPSAAVVGGAVAGTVAAIALLVAGAPTASPLIVGVAAFTACELRRRHAERKLRADRAAEVLELCFACAAELRAGRPPADAVAGVAVQLPLIGVQIAAAARAARLGAGLDEELAVVADTPGCRRLRPVAAAWGATVASGARAADLLERLGSTFAAEDAARAELQAQVAGPQATVVVLAVLPLVAVAFGAATGAHPMTFLLHTHVGSGLAVAAAGLDALGVCWMRRIMRRALAP